MPTRNLSGARMRTVLARLMAASTAVVVLAAVRGL